MKRLPLVLVLAGCAALVSCAADEPVRRDVLFIALDDMNDWVGVLGGHPQASTPNIDRLAARGMVFANAHTAAPLCNPSRTALMTGLRPSTSGVYGNGADWRTMEVFEGLPTLPRHFRDAGYATRGAGKLFHAHTYAANGFTGYNDQTAWDAFYPSLERQLPDELGPPAPPANDNPGHLGFDWAPLVAEDTAIGDGQVVTWVTEQIADVDGPRFLAAGIYRPHLPWYVPGPWFDLHPLEDIQLPEVVENDLDDVPEYGRRAALRADEMHDWVLEAGVWDQAVQGYLASTSFADAMVGRLIDALDASGKADNTIVVLIGDHGFHLGEKHRWRKQTLWEEATRVPLIVVAPDVTTPGTRTDAPVSLMDVYPTLTELAGIGTPAHLEGTSLVPLLEDPDTEWDHVAITTNVFEDHAVRDRRFRYIRHPDGSEELYDHEADPNEWTNVIDDPALTEVRERLASALPNVNTPVPRPAGGGRGRGATDGID